MKFTKSFKLKGKDAHKYIEKFAVGEDVAGLAKARVRFDKPYRYG